jgi:pimeloyl-ACP methyl ester carboxylesterase
MTGGAFRRNGPIYAIVGILLVPVLLYAVLLGVIAWNQTRFIYPGAGRPVPTMQQGWKRIVVRTARHGTQHAYVRQGESGAPVVLFLHGNYGSYDSVVSATRTMVEAGLTVVAPEYPGFGGDRSIPSADGLDDVALAAFDGLVEQDVRTDRIVVVGNSLGSAPAIAVATMRRPAGLVLVSAFTDMRIMARRRFPLAPGFLLTDAFDNATAMPKVRVPVMIVHGSKDDFVPTEMGRELARAAGVEPILVDAGHDAMYREDTQRVVAERVREWTRD